VSLSVSPIRDDRGAIVGAAKIARDVTESNRLRRAERELNALLQEQAVELEQQIEEAQMLQEEVEQVNAELQRAVDEAQEANRAKGQFLATMSHELRTPLNAIAGYVDLLDAGIHGPLTDDQRRDLQRVKRNQETLLRLIEDVLDFTKLESGRLEFRIDDVPLDDLLRSLEAFIAPNLAKKNITFALRSCGADVRARADRGKLEQILLNLLSNAVKFTQTGRIEVRCVVEDGMLRVEVSDTGRGIRPDQLESIFEPFVQAEQHLTRTAEGTGLGLSISRQLARGMGGDVTVASEPGKGSTFTLSLPRSPQEIGHDDGTIALASRT
jgi:signal transduction histidine kinase